MPLHKLKRFFVDFIYAGHGYITSADVRKQILICSIFSLVSIFFLVIFGLGEIRRGEIFLPTVVLGCAVISLLNYLYLWRSGNYLVSAFIIVLLMMSLSFLLLCTGGVDDTGPLWFYIMPSLTFYVLGFRWGLAILAMQLLLVASILYLPGNPLLTASYAMNFVHRFYASLLSVSVIAAAYEFTREEGRKELTSLNRKLSELSRRDELTGLLNRRGQMERLQHELDRYERTHHPFAILLIDIDHFKQVNDTYGHEIGDFALRQLGQILDTHTKKRDTASRWGGEEFLMLLPDTAMPQAINSAERLRRTIADRTMVLGGYSIHLMISIGIAQYSEGKELKAFISEADRYLYMAKERGRNRVCSASYCDIG